MANHPNLIYVFPDELRQQALGFMGQDPVVTPNIDQFASESLVLTHASSPFPVCSPHRAMLLTGQYPYANSVLTNCNSDTVQDGIYLKEEATCFSDVLHDAGYDLGYIGKWHLDPPDEAHVNYTEGFRDDGRIWDTFTSPNRRHSFDFWYSYGCCDQHLTPHYWTGNAPVDKRIDVNEWSVKHETDVAIRYLRNEDGTYRNNQNPFALFVSYNPPHMPFDEVPPQYLEPYDGLTAEDLLNRPNVKYEGLGELAPQHVKNYFAAITGIDEQFGRILDTVKEAGLADDTIVIFTSDHGEMMGSQGLMYKSVWYDESFLVPFIIRFPKKITPRQDDVLLSTPDIMPTLLNMMGVEAIPDSVEGSDLSAILLDKESDRPESAFYLVTSSLRPDVGFRGVRTHRYMLVVQREENMPESLMLYDSKHDPYQLHNVADDQPNIVNALTEKLRQWLIKTNDPWLTALDD